MIVASKNFGIGLSREQSVEALKYLGVSTVVAKSFAGIFFRNAFNFGVIALTSAEIVSSRATGSLSMRQPEEFRI